MSCLIRIDSTIDILWGWLIGEYSYVLRIFKYTFPYLMGFLPAFQYIKPNEDQQRPI